MFNFRVMVELLPFQGIFKEHANISFSLESVFLSGLLYSNWIDGLKLVRLDYPYFVMKLVGLFFICIYYVFIMSYDSR